MLLCEICNVYQNRRLMKKPGHLTLIALRHSTKHPIQSLLLILGVALGVAMIIAIDLANSSASQAFALSTESIAGRATHQIVASPGNVPSTLYEQLRVRGGFRNTAPVVTGQIKFPEANNLPIRLLGVDPLAEAPFRSYLGGGEQGALSVDVLTSLLLEPNTILLSQQLGEQLALVPGDTFPIEVEGELKMVRLVGLLEPTDDLSRRALARLALSDISTAQEILGMEGSLSHIDLILPETINLQPLVAGLPAGIQLQRADLRNETLDQLTAAFELNLTALSMLGVVVGMFLIYNTISFSVVQRRPVLGMLRCLGVTRREIFGLVLTEAIVLSAIGTAIGLGLGILMGRGLVGLVTQTINDLFFNLTVQGVSLQPLSVYKGIAAGLGAGLIAASIPAFEATTIPPISTLKRSTAEARIQTTLPWITLAGLILIIGGGALLNIPSNSLVISFSALFLIVIGMALLTPLLTKRLLQLISRLIQPYSGLIGTMALRDIVRALSRTSVTIAALMVSVSVIIGVSVMIASFRNTVVDWLDTILVADIFVSPVGDQSSIDPEFIKAVRQIDDVERVALNRSVMVFTPNAGQVQINAFSDSDQEQRNFFWAEGGPDQALKALAGGDILVSEVFARQRGLPLNEPSEFSLVTTDGARAFRIAGIFYNYSPQGFILMDLDVYQQFWGDTNVSNVALYVADNVDTDQLVTNIQTQYSGMYQISAISNKGLKQSAIVVFDRTFTITSALRLLAMVVAFVGVLSALMALQLEKTRELGTLRANGMTIRQLWALTFVETGFMGAIAGIIAMPTGLIMAAILIYVINLRSFGWSLQLQLAPQVFIFALIIAIFAALVAGIYPASRLGKMEIASALREE